MAINMTQKMLQPQWMATLSVLGGTFMGFFYSLIISFFLNAAFLRIASLISPVNLVFNTFVWQLFSTKHFFL